MPRPALDLNLLRLFDAVYRHRNISRAAAEIGLSQPAASQALTRLRQQLEDPLFERAGAGVRPTARAERLALRVQAGLAEFDAGLSEDEHFDPQTSTAPLRLHLTDIGQARFLPRLIETLHREAPSLRLLATTWPLAAIPAALHAGELDFAIGYFPDMAGTARRALVTDRYELLVRAGHPLTRRRGHAGRPATALADLEYIAVQSHSESLRLLRSLRLEHRVRLVTTSFLALPAIVLASDLAVLMPRQIALGFEPRGSYALVDIGVPDADFKVSVHWSRRHQHGGLQRWALKRILDLFEGADAGGLGEGPGKPVAPPTPPTPAARAARAARAVQAVQAAVSGRPAGRAPR